MAKFLLFQLYGPLASWGIQASGEMRHSDDHITKSAVIGLLAAALGVQRDCSAEQQALARGYGMACRVEMPGPVLRDFHTIQTPPAASKVTYRTRYDEIHWPGDHLYTSISKRDYRQDSACTIALWARQQAPYQLAQLAAALKQPRYVLYLGRKSCPVGWPLLPQVLAHETLLAAFNAVPTWYQRYSEWGGQHASSRADWDDGQLLQTIHYYWEELNAAQSGLLLHQQHRRYDVPDSRIHWQFSERYESFGSVPPSSAAGG